MLRLHLFLLASLIYSYSASSMAESETGLKVRFVHYDREFENESNDRLQNGFGVIFRHQQSFLNDKLKFSAAGYVAEEISATGNQREDVFSFDGERVNGFTQLGEAYVSINPNKNFSIKYGRDQHKSLLLKSKTRALPSTFEGLSVNWQSKKNHVYAHRFTKWSRRANDKFESFQTNLSSEGAINSVIIFGASHKDTHPLLGKYSVSTEYLESSDYIRKWGLVGNINKHINDTLNLKIKAAVFTSRDAGDLFVDGANSALDVIGDNSGTRLTHRGLGAYLTLTLENKNHSVSFTRSQFDEPWLEDSFDDDHGTTPFPTRTYGPELTNANETVWLIDYGYQWKAGLLNGLKTNLIYAKGTGAENSSNADLGQGRESWAEADISYKHPSLKKLKLRLRYRDYKSSVNGNIEGIASDRNELRFTVDYSYSF